MNSKTKKKKEKKCYLKERKMEKSQDNQKNKGEK